MTQSIDVIVIFDKAVSIPKPLRFKIYDTGRWKSVNVDRIYNSEWVRKDGKVQIEVSDQPSPINAMYDKIDKLSNCNIILGVFCLIVAEVFAIGLKLKESKKSDTL